MSDTRRIREPPAALGNVWFNELADEINTLPPTSVFSFSTPESNVTARAGTLGVNLASNASVFWVKQLGSDNTGWQALA